MAPSSLSSAKGSAVDRIALQTIDDEIIHTSRSLLTQHSSFFANLPPFTDVTSGEPLFLPAATSAGLHLVIAVLEYATASIGQRRAKKQGRWVRHDIRAKVTLEHLQPVFGALIIADVYDLPEFSRYLVSAASMAEKNQPLLVWAISAISGDVDDKVKRRLAMRTLLPILPLLLEETRNMLGEIAPSDLALLDTWHAKFELARSVLLADLTAGERITNGFANYGRRCRESTRSWRPCGAFASDKEWADLRRCTAEKVYDFVAVIARPYIRESDIQRQIDQIAQCGRCTTRLYRTFARPIRRFWSEVGGFANHENAKNRLR